MGAQQQTRVLVDPAGRAVRTVRAAVLAAPTVSIAALAHGMAGGCAPIWAITTAALGAWPLAYAILGVRHSARGLLAWVVATQVLTHTVLDLGCAGHHGTDNRMLAVHGVAALITAGLLARADAGLWLAKAIVAALRPAPAVASPEIPRATPAFAVQRNEKGRWVATQADPRGPPQLVAA